MANPAEMAQPSGEHFVEKDFYLDEFRAHTLCFAVALRDCEEPRGLSALGGVLRDLLAHDTRVIVLLGMPVGGREVEAHLQRIRRRLRRFVLTDETLPLFPASRGRRSAAESFIDLTDEADEDSQLERIWNVLRRQPLLVAAVDGDALVSFAERLAGRLRVHKLVITERAGGITTSRSGPISFMDGAVLQAVLQTGEAEWAGLQGRRRTFEAVRGALLGGVRAVNLCSLEGLARELFTYEGSGTLFTLEDYCRIERLGIDDFEEVFRLIERGQQEGYLRVRSPEEITRILLNGYGATIGAHHLAGVCALETAPYRSEQAGEIVGLYTITRFKGEGVGVRLVERVLQEAHRIGLRYVFACTSEPRAAAFFKRVRFQRVQSTDVPAAKWVGYDERRRHRLEIFRRELDD